MRKSRLEVIAPALLAAGALLAATAALKYLQLAASWRLLIALVPVPAYIYFLVAQVNAVRRLDELQRRIHLESLVFAFPTTFVGILTTYLVWLAGFLPGLDINNGVTFFLMLMIVLFVTGRILAARRYR